MHTLVDMLYITRQEFERNLRGLTDEDARKRIEPMNCISWIIAHVAWQHRSLFVDWPAGRPFDAKYQRYGYGSPASQPPLEEAMELWRNACGESDDWLQTATTESLQGIISEFSPEGENWGTLLARCIFHTWCHIGEISSIRQILGHKPPEFVNMREWSYEGN